MTALIFRYAFRTLLQDRRKALFSLLSLALGVLTIISLLQLSHLMNVSLTKNVEYSLAADVLARKSTGAFSAEDLGILEQLKAEGLVSRYTAAIAPQQTMAQNMGTSKKVPMGLRVVDPAAYPLKGELRLRDSGRELPQLLSGDEIVISEQLAGMLGLQAGDTIRIANLAAARDFTVAALAIADGQNNDSENERFFGYAFISPAQAEDFQLEGANRIFITTPDVPRVAERLAASVEDVKIDTADSVRQENLDSLTQIDFFLRIVGVLAVLISSLAVVTTMQSLIAERKTEIATLKMLGYDNRRIGAVYLAMSLYISLMAGLIAAAASPPLILAVKALMQKIMGVPLVFAWDLQATAVGLAFGVFSCLAVSLILLSGIAGIGPKNMLREATAGRSLRIRLLFLLLTAVALGVLTVLSSWILASLQYGAYFTLGLAAVFGLLLIVHNLLLALLARAPAFGFVPLKIARRNLAGQRRRAALTAAALTMAVFSIALSLFLGRAIDTSVREKVSEMPYNLLVLSGSDANGEGRRLIEEEVSPSAFTQGNRAAVKLVGADVAARHPELAGRGRELLASVEGVDLLGAKRTDLVEEGRDLGPGDVNQNNVLVPERIARELDLQVGDKLWLRSRQGRVQEVRVVGFIKRRGVDFSMALGAIKGSVNLVQELDDRPDQTFWLKVADGEAGATASKLNGRLPQLLIVDAGSFTDIFVGMIDDVLRLTYFMVLLFCVCAFIVVANTVNLAVIERKNDIAIMKAVGISGGSMRLIILLEGIAGIFLAGLLGSLLAAGFMQFFVSALFGINARINLAFMSVTMILAITGLGSLVILGAAWRPIKIKPMRILRYE